MRAATSRAMKSSTSLCRHVCPHKCFDPGRIRFREFHPLTRISPPCSLATNQWFVCFFSAPQMSHEIACRITAFPPGRRTSLRIRQPTPPVKLPCLRRTRKATESTTVRSRELQNRLLYFIVRSAEKVSEIKNESVRGSKTEGWKFCPETEHSLFKLSYSNNRSSPAPIYCLGAK